MNLAQLRTAARDLLMAGGGQNEDIDVDAYWADNTLTYLLNEGQRELEKIIRRARADFFTRILRTTDSALIIDGRTFTPSSLAWVAGTGNYQLPSDVVQLKLITDLAEDPVRVIMGDLAKNEFRNLMNNDAQNGTGEYMADILGIRTLVVRPIPQESRDLEFIYIKRLGKLIDYSTGSITVTQGSTVATFSGSANIQDRLIAGDEIIIGHDATEQSVPDPNETYPVIASIDSATQATLSAPWLGDSAADYAYTASRVSEIPEDHHNVLITYCVKEAFKIGPNPHSDSAALWETKWQVQLPSLVNDVEMRQIQDFESVQAYLEDHY